MIDTDLYLPILKDENYNKEPLTKLFKELLLNKDFNKYFYESEYEDQDITELQYIFIGAINWYFRNYCLDEHYNIINHNDFVHQVVKWFEDLYWIDQYINEVIIVGFVEGLLEIEQDKMNNFLKLFSNEVLIKEIIEYYEVIYWKKLQINNIEEN